MIGFGISSGCVVVLGASSIILALCSSRIFKLVVSFFVLFIDISAGSILMISFSYYWSLQSAYFYFNGYFLCAL